jgi:hypothetical protein
LFGNACEIRVRVTFVYMTPVTVILHTHVEQAFYSSVENLHRKYGDRINGTHAGIVRGENVTRRQVGEAH